MGGALSKVTAGKETKKAIADLLAKDGGVYGTEMSSDMGNAIEFMAAQVEFTADVLAQGTRLTPRDLSRMLVLKGLSLSDLSRDDYIKCSGAMVSLAISLQTTVVTTAATGAGGVLPAILLVADLYMTAQDCAPAAIEIHKDVTDKVTTEINRYDWSPQGIMYWITNMH